MTNTTAAFHNKLADFTFDAEADICDIDRAAACAATICKDLVKEIVDTFHLSTCRQPSLIDARR